MLSLNNTHLNFSIDPNTGRWDLSPRSRETPFIEAARLGAILAVPGRRRRSLYWDGDLIRPRPQPLSIEDSAHGPLRMLRLDAAAPLAAGEALAVTLEFALPDQHPFFLWRVSIRNEGAQPLALEAIDLLRVGPRFQTRSGRSGLLFRLSALLGRDGRGSQKHQSPPGALRLHEAPGRLAFFSNGYQSWSFAGALQAGMRQPSSIFGPLGDPKAINLLTPRLRSPGRFSSDMFAVLGDRQHDAGMVAGFLSQREQFSAVEAKLDALAPSLRLTAQCDDVPLLPGESRAADWAFLQFVSLGQPEPLASYVDAVARENGARVPELTPVGWCSWYHYFDRVTETDIVSNLAALAERRDRLPLNFVQIDDGYQQQVGDWFETKPAFPHGLKWLAAEIWSKDHVPGLWLAPYLVRSDAGLLREHPGWFLRTPRGRLANAGYNWFKWCYGLDPTHPEVRAHVRRLITTAVHDWGFPYLKLDFLYAAALPGRRFDPSLTRAQAMRLALEDIREAAGPETFLLGCGCPLGSAVGLVDGMRVSTDVAPDWNPHLFTPRLAPLVRREMDFVGVRNAIRNTINRAALHRRWWLNDPDCLLVRDHDTRLTEAEVRSLASVIALSGGMFLLSDDMSRLSPERLRYVAPLLPVLGISAHAPNWMEAEMPDLFQLSLRNTTGAWLVAGIFNWEDHPADRTLDLRALGLDPDCAYFVSDFWDQSHGVVPAGQPLRLAGIPPHGARLLAIRAVPERGPALVASSFHFSQGGEVSGWQTSSQGLQFRIELGRRAEGEVRLALPAGPHGAAVEGAPIEPESLGQGLYALRFSVSGSASVWLAW